MTTEQEKQNDLHLNFLVSKTDNETQGSVMSKKENNTTLKVKKSFEH